MYYVTTVSPNTFIQLIDRVLLEDKHILFIAKQTSMLSAKDTNRYSTSFLEPKSFSSITACQNFVACANLLFKVIDNKITNYYVDDSLSIYLHQHSDLENIEYNHIFTKSMLLSSEVNRKPILFFAEIKYTDKTKEEIERATFSPYGQYLLVEAYRYRLQRQLDEHRTNIKTGKLCT